MNRIKHSFRRISIDIAGFTLLALVPFLGPLPGPGGVPLILAGLGLLSINHEWARQLRTRIAKGGNSISKRFFPDRNEVKLLYDVLTLCVVSYGVWLFGSGDSRPEKLLAYACVTGGMLIFGLNRGRFDTVERWFSRVFKKS